MIHLDRGTVNLDLDGIDLRQALDELFLTMGVKHDLPPEVQGTVTARVHNMTYRQALDTLLGRTYTNDIGPHDTIHVHKRGTTWKPGAEEAA